MCSPNTVILWHLRCGWCYLIVVDSVYASVRNIQGEIQESNARSKYSSCLTAALRRSASAKTSQLYQWVNFTSFHSLFRCLGLCTSSEEEWFDLRVVFFHHCLSSITSVLFCAYPEVYGLLVLHKAEESAFSLKPQWLAAIISFQSNSFH